MEVPKTGGATEWKTLHGYLTTELTAGRHVFTLLVDQGGFNIKDITFNRYEEADGSCVMKSFDDRYGVGDHVTVSAKATSRTSTISEVRFYANGLLIGTDTEKPYQCVFIPTEKRTYDIMAVSLNAEGKEKRSQIYPLQVTSDTPLSIQTIESDNEPDTPTYNIMGMPVDANYRGIVIKNGKKYVIK